MMLVLLAGVKKSVLFNNTLNAINLAVFVFMLGAGLYYADGKNWSDHGGFLPFGWSGVSWRDQSAGVDVCVREGER